MQTVNSILFFHKNYDVDLQKRDVLFIIIFFVSALISKFLILSKTSYANGTDGYVYLIQVKSMLSDGRMHFKDSSLVYPYLAGLTYVFGDPVISLKIGISVLGGFFSGLVYYLTLLFSGNRVVSITTALLSIFSPSIIFIAFQFPKNFMAIIIFFLFIVFQLKRNIYGLFITLLAAFVTHRLVAGVLIIYFFLKFVFSQKIRFVLISLFVLVLGAGIISVVLPGTLHVYDIERFTRLLSTQFQIAPYSFINTLGSFRINIPWKIELFVLYLAALSVFIFNLIKFIRNELEEKTVFYLSIISMFFIFPFFRFEITGAAFRFFLTFIPIAIIISYELLNFAGRKVLYSASVFLIILSVFITVTFNPVIFDPPYKLYEKISNNVKEFIKDKKMKLLVAHKPMAEMIDYNLNIDVLPWHPERHFNRINTWRIVKDIEIWEVEPALKKFSVKNRQFLIKQVSAKYFILREDVWENFVEIVKQDDNEDLVERVFSKYNPYKVRPEYLTRFKK